MKMDERDNTGIGGVVGQSELKKEDVTRIESEKKERQEKKKEEKGSDKK